MNTLFEVILNAFQGVMMIAFMKNVTDPRRDCTVWMDIVFGTAISAVLSAYTFFDIPIPDTFIFILPFAYVSVTDRGSWSQRILWTFVLGGVMTYVSVIMVNVYDTLLGVEFNTLLEPGIARTGFTVTANIAMALILFAISRLGSRYTGTIMPSEMSAIMILLLISQFIAAELSFLSKIAGKDQDLFSILSIICAFASSAITYIMFGLISKTVQMRHKQEIMHQTMVLSRKYQEDIGTIYKRMLIAQHDLKHQIDMAHGILERTGTKDNSEKLKTAELMSSIIATGCISADAVLTAKKDAAVRNGIYFDLEPFPLDSLPINEMDFCILLTNLLDNAIEGAKHSMPADRKRYVHLHFRRAWNMFNIVCRNTVDLQSVNRRGGRFISCKTDSGFHGLGTESIRQTVLKYNGTCEFSTENDVFSVAIVMRDAEE